MAISKQIAKHFKDVYFSGNWTCSNLKEQLKDVNYKEAQQQIQNCNTILTLVYHIHYFVRVVSNALKNNVLEGNDKLSFNHPSIHTEDEWQTFLNQIFKEAKNLVILIEQLPDDRLTTVFFQEKYGSYYRNLNGVIEHTHYHLGQIAIIKKLIKG